MNKWKEIIYKKVKQHDVKKWKVTCTLHKSLCYVNLNVQNMKMSPWWVHAAQNVLELKVVRLIVQLLLGKDRQEIGICKLCNQQPYSAHHIIFDCIILYQARIEKWAFVIENCENHFVEEIDKMYSKEKCIFIFNGFNISYTSEWQAVYSS